MYQGLDGENDYLILLELHMEEIHMDKGMMWTECGRQMGQSYQNILGAEKENPLDFIGDVYHGKNHKKWQLEGFNYTSSIVWLLPPLSQYKSSECHREHHRA